MCISNAMKAKESASACRHCGAPYESIPLQPTEVGGVTAAMAGFAIRHKDGCPEGSPQSESDSDG